MILSRWIICVCLVGTVLLTAQESISDRRRREYPALHDLSERAQSVHPELRSLALTTIAKQPSLRDREWKIELLEQAFEAALLAHIENPVSYVPPADGTKPPPRIAQAHRLNRGLDRLTLSTSAVAAMIPLDAGKALRMFERIPTPELRVYRCKQSLLPDTSTYFRTAASVPGAEAHAMGRFVSALQTASAAAMLSSSPELVQRFAGQLSILPVESRAWRQSIETASEELSKLALRVDPATRVALLGGWRSYLTRGLNAAQCAESAERADQWRQMVIDVFHKQPGVDPLREHETKPGETLAGCDDNPEAVSDKQKRIGEEAMMLLVSAGKSAHTPEWRARFRKHLNEIENVPKSEVSEDLLIYKAGAFATAALAAPEGDLRELASARFLDQMKISNLTPEALPGWYSALSDWLHLMQSLRTPKAKALELLETSGQPLLVIFAQIEKL